MNAPPTLSAGGATPHRCPVCARRFFVVPGRSVRDRAHCVCGAELVAEALAGGVYEVRRSRRATRKRPRRKPAGAASDVATPDLGYGESHGYGPAHGGPSGPGDAPSDEAVTETPDTSPDAST